MLTILLSLITINLVILNVLMFIVISRLNTLDNIVGLTSSSLIAHQKDRYKHNFEEHLRYMVEG